ncbi:unnamed protein product, partial [marine sediment metagenome]
IAVTVDMISTGTDIQPLECLIFMRDVKSRVYFEQMKGRGTRTIDPDSLQGVTPDARHKTHFIIIDAVGVCENDKTDSRPLERKKSVSFDKLIMSVAIGKRDEDTLTSLAGRLARLDKRIGEKDRKEIETASAGKSLNQIINNLLDTVDSDKQYEKAKEMFKVSEPTEEYLGIKRDLFWFFRRLCKIEDRMFFKFFIKFRLAFKHRIESLNSSNANTTHFVERVCGEVLHIVKFGKLPTVIRSYILLKFLHSLFAKGSAIHEEKDSFRICKLY